MALPRISKFHTVLRPGDEVVIRSAGGDVVLHSPRTSPITINAPDSIAIVRREKSAGIDKGHRGDQNVSK